MSKKAWIITLVGVGVVLAVVLGLLANSQSVAEKKYCNSLDGLQSSLVALTSLNATAATSGQVQSDVDAVQSAWSDVKSAGSKLSDDNQANLNSAWDSFQTAVGNLNDGGSTADVQSAATGLETAVQSSIKSYDCGNVSTTTTTTSS